MQKSHNQCEAGKHVSRCKKSIVNKYIYIYIYITLYNAYQASRKPAHADIKAIEYDVHHRKAAISAKHLQYMKPTMQNLHKIEQHTYKAYENLCKPYEEVPLSICLSHSLSLRAFLLDCFRECPKQWRVRWLWATHLPNTSPLERAHREIICVFTNCFYIFGSLRTRVYQLISGSR